MNKQQGQRIIILQVVLVLKRNKHLWLYIDSQLILRIVNYETTRKSFVLCTRRQIACEMLLIVWSVSRSRRKNENSGAIWHKSSIQTAKILFPWQTNCLSKFLQRATHVQNFFLLGKVLCIGMRRQVTCEMFIVCCSLTRRKKLSPALFEINCSFKG